MTPSSPLRNAERSVLSFDLWMTLIRSNPEFRPARNAVFRSAIAPAMPAEEFDRIVHEQDSIADTIAEQDGRDMSFEERVQMIAQAATASHVNALTMEGLYQQQTELLETHPPILLSPRTADVLEQLGTRYDLAVISNTGFIRGREMRRMLGSLGVLESFQYLIFSNEIDSPKPDKRIFDVLLQLAQVPAGAVTHIGDNMIADIHGARSAGMRAIHLKSGMTIENIARRVEAQ